MSSFNIQILSDRLIVILCVCDQFSKKENLVKIRTLKFMNSKLTVDG